VVERVRYPDNTQVRRLEPDNHKAIRHFISVVKLAPGRPEALLHIRRLYCRHYVERSQYRHTEIDEIMNHIFVAFCTTQNVL